MNVGECQKRKCPGDSGDGGQCGRGESNCCGPIEYTKVTVICSNITYTFDVITTCGCQENLPQYINVDGTVVENENPRIAIENASVFYNDEVVSITDHFGLFGFTVMEELERVTFSVKPPAGSGYTATTQTLTLTKGTSGVLSTTVKLLASAPAVEIDSSMPEPVSFSAINDNTSLGELYIPPDSFFTESGELVTVSLTGCFSTGWHLGFSCISDQLLLTTI